MGVVRLSARACELLTLIGEHAEWDEGPSTEGDRHWSERLGIFLNVTSQDYKLLQWLVDYLFVERLNDESPYRLRITSDGRGRLVEEGRRIEMMHQARQDYQKALSTISGSSQRTTGKAPARRQPCS